MTTTIAVPELEHLLDDPATTILDVRTGAEYETAHIPGSYNVPLATLHEHAGRIAETDSPVVLVCQSGARATEAHTKLLREGKQELRILDGGIAAWQKAGNEVVLGEERWALERQVRLVAGGLVLAGILASTVVPKAKWLSGAIGAGLTFAAISNTCAMGAMLSKLPYNQTADACDIDAIVAELNTAA